MAHTIILNCDFLEDPKLAPIIEVYGEALTSAYYLRLITMMAKQGGVVPKTQGDNFGRRLNLSKNDWGQFIKLCLDNSLIFTDGENYSCKRLIIDKKNLETKRDYWRDKKRLQRSGKLESETEQEQETEQENTNKKIASKKIKYGEHVHFTQTEVEKFTNELSPETFKQCWEKLDAYIASDPTPKKKRNGWNGAATLRSWVIRAVTEERQQPRNGSPPQRLAQNVINNLRTLETLKKYEDLEENENSRNGKNIGESISNLPTVRPR